MKIIVDDGGTIPTIGHATDAGIDLCSREDKVIRAKSSATFDTGIHVQLPKNTCGLLVSKSGLNVKKGITSTGLIDEGYTGSIIVKLYNNSWHKYKVNKGDKITQLVVLPIKKEKIEIVDSLEKTDRGDNGFGSTGK